MSKTLVIIPHYNKILLLKECLFHLENQDYNDFDIMIVDNGSTDGSANYIFDLNKKSSRYKHILNSENMGFAYAVNRGLEYSINNSYEYSILLNNDAYVDKSFVKSLVHKIGSKKRLFACSSLMINYHNKNLIDSFGDNYSILGFGYQNHIDECVDTVFKDEYCFSACGGASIYRNDVLKKIGLFDENFFAYLEDIDISYRAKLNGYSISTSIDSICYHLGSATSGSKYNEFKVRISARNSIYLLYKNMPLIQILINFIPLSMGFIVKQIFFVYKGFGLDYFFGIFDGFKNRKYIVKNDFKKYSIINYVLIEIELIVNTFKYIRNFLTRHL